MADLYLRKQTDFTEKKLFPYITTEHLRMDLLPLVRKLAKSKDPDHPWIALDDMELFRSAGLYEQDYVTGQSGFNLAAVLLFGKDETIKSYLPAYRTDAVLRVDNTDRYDDRDDVRTNLIVLEYDGKFFEVEFFDDDGNTIDVLTTTVECIELEKEF